MAIILENTPWEYAVDSTANVNKLVYASSVPKSILINIAGRNSGWKVGETITYINGSTRFTGAITYIYQGSTSFNLYINHPNPASLKGMPGGVVTSGNVPIAPDSNKPYDSAATINTEANEANENLATPSGTVVGASPEVVASLAAGGSSVQANVIAKLKDPKIIVGGIILVIAVLYFVKGKGKKVID